MPSQFPLRTCRHMWLVSCPIIHLMCAFVYSEFPEQNPTIDDIKQYYSIGENLETNCTSNSSIPPAKVSLISSIFLPKYLKNVSHSQLEWWINDMPIYNAEYTIKYNTIVDPATNRGRFESLEFCTEIRTKINLKFQKLPY